MTTDQPTTEPTPAPPPPAKRTNVFAVVAAAFAALAIGLAAGIAIGTNLDDDEPVAAPSSSESQADDDTEPVAETTPTRKPSPTPTRTPTPTPTGPVAFAPGEPASITMSGTPAATVMVESFTTSPEQSSEYGEPPANGVFLTATIVTTALDGQTFDINPFDFYVRDDSGNRWDRTSGNAFHEHGDNDLTAVTLNGGETVRGTVVFDVPAEATELVYAPARRALAVWNLTTT